RATMSVVAPAAPPVRVSDAVADPPTTKVCCAVNDPPDKAYVAPLAGWAPRVSVVLTTWVPPVCVKVALPPGVVPMSSAGAARPMAHARGARHVGAERTAGADGKRAGRELQQ